MPRRKIEPYPILNEWLEEIVKNLKEAKTKGTKPILSQLLQSLINTIMLKERELFLKEHPENYANGFYNTYELELVKTEKSFLLTFIQNSYKPSLKLY